MSISAEQMKVLTPFVSETVKNLETMADLPSTAGLGTEDEIESFRFKGFAVAIETTGSIEGTILIHMYIETALLVGNKVREKMLGETEQATEVTDNIVEALEEWGNTVVGHATAVLEAYNLGIKFKPPYFIHSTEKIGPIMEEVQEIISIPIRIDEDNRFYFNFLLNNKTGADT
ncbi:MAG: chemotaxis protein CheX [Gammaproteobacteria bacterium]|nr:chemotaxis protein CheX [Gammaproteobacteria bacterium]